MTQCPTPVAIASINSDIDCNTSDRVLDELLRSTRPDSNTTRPIKSPLKLTTPRERLTIAPAISLAFGTAKDRNTPKAAGATTTLKKSAAPNQHATKIKRMELMTRNSFSIKSINGTNQTYCGRNNLRDW